MKENQQRQIGSESEEHQEEFLTSEEILEEYRRRQMIEHLTGPVISLVLHVVIIGLFAFFLAGREIVATTTEIEFDIREMEIKPIDPEILEQLEQFEPEFMREVVPTVERPEIQPDQLDQASIDEFADSMAMSDLDMGFAAELDIRPSRSPLVIPTMMSGRTAEGRREGLARHGGRWARHTEIAVIRALEWLKENQEPDGSWHVRGGQASARTGMTGLALLSFLAHGQQPNSDRYGDTVRRAIEFLVSVQKEDGSFGFTEGGNRGGVYSHGIAAYALSEAYALSRIPSLRGPVEQAIARIIRGQRPDGGFDYNFVRDGGERDRCTSVAGWMAQAMKAAHLSGIEIEGLEPAIELAAQGFKLNYHERAQQFIYASYESTRGQGALPGPNLNQTPIGVLCLQLLGHGTSPEARGALVTIRSDFPLPDWERPHSVTEPLYGWYYATQALFHDGVSSFRRWNDAMAPALVRSQRPDGSWELPSSHGRSAEYSPVYSTSLATLILTVYYRYLPTYQDPEAIERGFDIFAFDDDDELTLQ